MKVHKFTNEGKIKFSMELLDNGETLVTCTERHIGIESTVQLVVPSDLVGDFIKAIEVGKRVEKLMQEVRS